MIANVLKNWKTSLLGVATGAGIAFLSSVQGGMRPKDALVAAGLAHLATIRRARRREGHAAETDSARTAGDSCRYRGSRAVPRVRRRGVYHRPCPARQRRDVDGLDSQKEASTQPAAHPHAAGRMRSRWGRRMADRWQPLKNA